MPEAGSGEMRRKKGGKKAASSIIHKFSITYKILIRVKPPVGGFDSHTPPPPLFQGIEASLAS
jgi:hypothetical protein